MSTICEEYCTRDHQLQLKDIIIKPHRFKQIVQWQQSNQLVYMRLENNQLKPQHFKYLQKARWKTLTLLLIRDNELGISGLKYISSGTFHRLNYINLDRCGLTELSFKYLSRVNTMPLVRTLIVGKSFVNYEGMVYLSKANCKSLTTLDLRDNMMKGGAMLMIQQMYLPELTYFLFGSVSLYKSYAELQYDDVIPLITKKLHWAKLKGTTFYKDYQPSYYWSSEIKRIEQQYIVSQWNQGNGFYKRSSII